MTGATLPAEKSATWMEPGHAEFLRLFGAICAVGAVGRVALGVDGAELVLWIRLTEDDIQSEHRVYEAEGEYLAAQASPPVELHVIFADEDESAFPSDLPVIFDRS